MKIAMTPALALVLTSSAFAQAQTGDGDDPAPAPNGPVDIRVVGHSRVHDVVAVDQDTYTLGDGLVYRWHGNVVTGWQASPDAIDLARTPDGIVATSQTHQWVFTPELETRQAHAIDGYIPCVGADAVWSWNEDEDTVWFSSPTVATSFPAARPPTADARCTVTPEGSALAWDDGERSHGLTDTGDELEGPETSPRAVFVDGSWRLVTADDVNGHALACDTFAGEDRVPCVALSDGAGDYVRPHALIVRDAAWVNQTLVVMTPTGWSTIDVSQTPPAYRVRVADTLAISADGATVFACADETLAALDSRSGAVRAHYEVSTCPPFGRSRGNDTYFVAGDTRLKWDAEQATFRVIGDTASAHLAVNEAWNAACADVASIVVTDSGRRVFGPACDPVRLVPVLTANGSDGGVGVCVGTDTAPLTGLRIDGTPFTLDRGARCDDPAIHLGTDAPAVDTLAQTSELTVRRTPSGLHVEGVGLSVSMTLFSDGLLMHSASHFWASPSLWTRIVWSQDGTTRRADSPDTDAVWNPAVLVVGAPADTEEPRPFFQRLFWPNRTK